MGLLSKLGIGIGAGTTRNVSRPTSGTPIGGRSDAHQRTAGAPRAPEMQEMNTRIEWLKEFLWNLDGLGRGTMLDLGPAWQTTLSFSLSAGFA